MISRVTASSMTQTAMRHLQSNLSELARLQEQATSQRAFAAPSDDPAAAAAALDLHAEQRRNDQYARNIDDGLAWVTTADSAITRSTALLGRVRDLTIQGANDGAMDATAKEAIAVELEGIRDELLAQANTRILGRSVFAGTSDTAAFDSAYAHSGSSDGQVMRRVSDTASVRVDTDGAAVFGAGAGSVFALVDNIISDLRSGTNVGPRLAEIDDRRDAMLSAQGAVGTRQSQIERAKEAAVQNSVSLESRRAAVEDVDSVEVLVKLQAQELVYRSALAVNARVLQPSLMDFLR
ncbi:MULTISPECIES: flagellar hook-associated protein FlgL [unclassified Microbacterium]|uniref:flagellar hook-associated protein FlgL n=1 Tax=unclassified Microbacterium TaxID=2609290 RepID=UPI001E098F4A|nr:MULTISPECIES: flagellar hook-associated protein FlgL [unclassified Microbacterium]CAH0214492.1 Flagellar hook-associated protein 3 [Microbacterium sp. Bi121]HWK76612.1 flagellar hook-associated protein FlgL [Microbacterium sp.]